MNQVKSQIQALESFQGDANTVYTLSSITQFIRFTHLIWLFDIFVFSNDYMLIGRKFLTAARADFDTQRVKMFSKKFKLINYNNTPKQNHFQEHPLT